MKQKINNKVSSKEEFNTVKDFFDIKINDWYKTGNKTKFDRLLLIEIEKAINNVLNKTKFSGQEQHRKLFVLSLVKKIKQALNAE